MAVPKNKTSHARKSSRRSTVWKINAPELTACPNCGELTAAHKACTNCGMYIGRQVVVKKDEQKFLLQTLRAAVICSPFCFANITVFTKTICKPVD